MTAVLAVIVVGTLAGCAGEANGPGGAGGRGAAGGSAAVPSGPDGSTGATPGPPSGIALPATPPASPGTTHGPVAGGLTLHGQVEQGVEPGCLILRSGGKTYELYSGNPAVVHVGAQVVVTGHVLTGVMSHCMQGQPFQVTSARRG